MNKKIIIMPIAVLALGVITGCNNNGSTVVTKESKYFFDASSAELEKTLEMPSSATNIELSDAQLSMSKGLTKLTETTGLKINNFKGSSYDYATTKAKSGISVKPLGKKVNYKVNNSIEFKPYSNHILEINSSKDESQTIDNDYKTQYVKEKNNSILFVKPNGTGEDAKIAVYNKQNEEYLSNPATSFYENYSAEETYETEEEARKEQEARLNAIVDNVFEMNKTFYVNETSEGYYDFNERIQQLLKNPEYPAGRITKKNGKEIYFYAYCSMPIDLDSDTSILYNKYLKNNTLVDDYHLISEQQNNELINLYNKNAEKGITYVINPSNVLDLEDMATRESIRSNCLSIFNYFLPVYQSVEGLYKLVDNTMVSASYKYATNLLKNEDKVELSNPISYSTEYVNITFSYDTIVEYTSPIEFDVERRDVPYSIKLVSDISAINTYNELKDSSIYDWKKHSELKKSKIHIIRGYVGRGTANYFSLNSYASLDPSRTTKYNIGYDRIVNTNVDKSQIYYDGYNIRWPENSNDAYILLYLNENGEIHMGENNEYGLSINFLFD